MNDRLMIAAMAIQGLCSDNTIVGRAGKTFAEVVSSMALECADALLSAAGEKDSFDDADVTATMATLRRGAEGYKEQAEFLRSRIVDCERERDALRDQLATQIAWESVSIVDQPVSRTEYDRQVARAEAAESKLVAVESFTPTVANINALPENLKRFVMELEALCDPSGIVAENTIARDTCRALESKLAACEMERDALRTKVADLEVNGERRESINRGLKHEIGMLALDIAALKRRLEPLTEEEGMAALAEVVTLHGMSSVDRTIAACKVCDRIRSRRQP